MVVRHPTDRVGHLRTHTVSGYDQRGGAAPSGAWLSYALPTRLSYNALRHHARVLAQGRDETTHLRDAPVETRGLFHHGGLRVQGGISLLRTRPPLKLAACSSAAPSFTLGPLYTCPLKHTPL